jgi:hypothetical protein
MSWYYILTAGGKLRKQYMNKRKNYGNHKTDIKEKNISRISVVGVIAYIIYYIYTYLPDAKTG